MNNNYIDNWTQLGREIVYQAMWDYEIALCLGNQYTIRECKEFFNSEWCSTCLSNMGTVDGKTIIAAAERRVRECNFDVREVKRLHNIFNTDDQKQES